MSFTEPADDAERVRTDIEGGLEAFPTWSDGDALADERVTEGVESDHLAVLYESREECLEAVVPFVRQGIEHGEKVFYVADERRRAMITSALEAGGVDVESALDAGALTIHGPEEAYFSDGAFDAATAVSTYEDAIESAADEYEGVRVTAETTWVRDASVPMTDFLEYEARVNDLMAGEPCVALCQYDRTAFEPEVIRDVIQSHPHLIYDGTVCSNVYYTPPSEYFGPDRADREVERMMETLVDRSRARTALQDRERALRDLASMTADPDRSLESKVEDLLALGCDRFDLELGYVTQVDLRTDSYDVDAAVGPQSAIRSGETAPLSGALCGAVVTADEPVAVADGVPDDWVDDPVFEVDDLGAAIGTALVVDGDCYGTLCFVSRTPREPFGPATLSFLDLLGQWLEYELERERRMGYQRDLYRLAADTDRSADGTLAALFDLGCDRFDLEFGGLARIDPDTDSFELEATSGDHDHLRPGATVPLSETYCRELASGDDTAAVADPDAAGLTDTVAYETFGVRSYVGTRVRVPNDADRSLFFVSTDHRPGGFSAADQTFLDLMGQLVGYELERDERERNLRHLYEITANRDASFQQKVEAVLSFGCERFGLERGYLVDVCPDDEGVEIEHAVGRGEPPRDRPTAGSGADQFTRRTIQLDCPIGVTDTHSLVCDADPIYDESDYRTYFGVTVTGDDGPYGTLAFCDRDARTRPFSAAEYTFLELLGQWVSHELVQRRRENQLAALNDMSRDLMSTATRAEIVTRTIDHAGESLHLPVSAIVEYDGDRGTLRPVAQTPRAESALPIASLCDRTDGPLWEAFVAGEATLVEDVTGNTDGSTDVTEVLAVPLDRERLFVSGTTAPTGLSAADRDFLAATAATVEAACARADREQELRTREETLELQNDVLERLNRVNDIIRNIDQALVGATSRGEIEAVVCEQLAGVGPYELAWVGDRDGADGSVTPKEWAGAKRDSISALRHEPTADGDACDVARRVAETGEPHVVNDVLEDGPVTPWHQTALNRGYHACIGLPLSYEESFYGVLVVYAGRPGVFDDLEQSVLAELTDTIAYAVNAVESKKAIVSDEVTTLDFDLADAELGVVEVAREFRCDVALENLVPGADGTFLAFISTRGAPPEDLYEAAAHLPLEDLTLVATHDDGEDPFGLFEVALPDGCLFTTVLEHGGRPCSFEITDGRPRLSVELAADAPVREFVEMFQAAFPGAELFAQRTRECPQQSATEFFAGLTDALTDRQLETLQMAYYSGYLNEPRRQRATDVADAMDISQPTFNSHLRAAQRRLCEQLFDEHAPAT